MIRDVAWPVLLGLIAGLVDTYHAMAIVATFLFETTRHDPATSPSSHFSVPS